MANYLDSDFIRKNIEKVDDLLSFATKYVSNVFNRDIKVKIGPAIATDLVGNIYLTIDIVQQYLEKNTFKNAAVELLSAIMHELSHWMITSKEDWDNGILKYNNVNLQKLSQILINSLEDGRCEAYLMNEYYGTIYPIMYSNNETFKKMNVEGKSPLDILIINILSMSVNYKVKITDVPKEIQPLQEQILNIIQEKNIWTLPSTAAIVEVSDIILEKIVDFFKDDNQQDDNQNDQSQQNQQNGDGDSQNNGQSNNSSSNQNNTENKEDKSQPNGQSSGSQNNSEGDSNESDNDSKGNYKSKNNSDGGKSLEQALNDMDFEALKELFQNYHEEAPGRNQGPSQPEKNVDDYIDFSSIANDIEINLDDIHIEELEALSEKYDKEPEELSYEYDKNSSNKSKSLDYSDNSKTNIVPNLKDLPSQYSDHKGVNVRIINLKTNALHREIYEKNKYSLETEIGELLLLLRNLLEQKIENQSEAQLSGYIDTDKIKNIVFENYDIFKEYEGLSDEYKNSFFIGVDLSASMLSRKKYMIKSLIILHEVLRELGIPHSIWGFNTQGRDVCHYPLITFDNWDDENASYTLAAIDTTGANRDGLSLRVFNQYIKESGFNPLYINITDGNPNHYNYSGDLAIQDTKIALEDMELPSIAICIGEKENINISEVYDNAIECEEIYQLPDLLHEFLLDVIV